MKTLIGLIIVCLIPMILSDKVYVAINSEENDPNLGKYYNVSNKQYDPSTSPTITQLQVNLGTFIYGINWTGENYDYLTYSPQNGGNQRFKNYLLKYDGSGSNVKGKYYVAWDITLHGCNSDLDLINFYTAKIKYFYCLDALNNFVNYLETKVFLSDNNYLSFTTQLNILGFNSNEFCNTSNLLNLWLGRIPNNLSQYCGLCF